MIVQQVENVFGTHEHEVDDTLLVCVITKVFVISSREPGTHPVVLVHHTRHTVESEAIKLELLDPIAKIAQQEPEHLV